MGIWVTRAGKKGEREDRALIDGRAYIGWREYGDFGSITTVEQAKEFLGKPNPEWPDKSLSVQANQLFVFLKKIQICDLFALPLKKIPAIAFGTVESNYEYIANNRDDLRHSRRIKWIGKPIPRKKFRDDLLKTFDTPLTVFSVKRNDAEIRVRVILEGKPDPGVSTKLPTDIDENNVLDIQEAAQDKIREYIKQRFKKQGLEDLVAEVLKVQGHEVSRKGSRGADGGVVISASYDAIGSDTQTRRASTKFSNSVIDGKSYRELTNLINTFGAKRGLIVMWGSFDDNDERKAKNEFKFRLWDVNDLVEQIQMVYSKLPKEIQDELPLKQIWTLADNQ